MGIIRKTIKDIFSPPDYKKLKEANKKFEKQEKEAESKIKGLGGWLILVQIGMFLNILISLTWALGFLLQLLLNFNGLILISFVFFISLGFVNVYTIILLYKKSKHFPNWAIFSLWYAIGIIFFLVLIFGTNLEDLTGFPILTLQPIIWTAYFLKSRRVKNTFVR